MSDTTTVLILAPRPENGATPSVQEMVDALNAAGARVRTHPCDENFAEILDAIEQADKVLVWR